MPNPSPHWPIPLHNPPEVVVAGRDLPGGAQVQRHKLPGLWCIHFHDDEGEVFVDDYHLCVHPGTVSVIPPAALIEFRYPRSPKARAFAHFRLSELIGGPRTPTIPATRAMEGEYRPLLKHFEPVLEWHTNLPGRAAARLWDVLWAVADAPEAGADGRPLSFHPALDDAVRFINLNLGAKLRVADIATAVSISNNQLTRLFRQRYDTTVVAFIRQRRVERARHLLQHTTLPIKTVAREVGLPDLQLFNKTIRKELGVSPTEVREGKAAGPDA